LKDIDVTGIGVSTIDNLFVVERFPSNEEVQRAFFSKTDGGGPVATAMVTLARLGARVEMIDSVGDDFNGRRILEDFKNEGVSTSYIKINNGHTSSCAAIFVRKQDGARTITYSPGSAPEFLPEELDENIIARSKFIHINGRHYEACRKACLAAKKFSVPVSFDGGAGRFNQNTKSLVSLSDICITAREFARQYTGELNIKKAGKILLGAGPAIVVISNGADGSYLFTKDVDCYWQKAYDAGPVVDTTGCGDSFHGAFLYGLCRGMELTETIKLASACAALNTRGLGGREALPDLKEVTEFLKLAGDPLQPRD